MPKPPPLTLTEWSLMEAIWELGGAPSVRDVVDAAYPNGEKAYTTVQTIMNKLVDKGMLRRRKTGLVNFYRPVHRRETMESQETRSLLSRVFGGSATALAHSLLNLEDLEREDFEAIKRMIRDRERELDTQEGRP